jgi:hypothetical protein
MHGAAKKNRCVELREIGYQLVHLHVEFFVEDKTYGALLVVLTNQHGSAFEIGVEHKRLGQQNGPVLNAHFGHSISV